MSTFLELARDLRQEVGDSGEDNTPISVTGQTGELKRIVDWITKADAIVQRKYPTWDFLRRDFSFDTLIGVNTYLPSAVNLDTLNLWNIDENNPPRCYLKATGMNDEQRMSFLDYDTFRDWYIFGAQRTVQGRPWRFTIRPQDKAFITWPTADAVYTFDGEYWCKPIVMAENADTPPYPDQFHRIVVHRGKMFYGAFEGAPEVYAEGQDDYNRMLGELDLDQGPTIIIGRAMA